MWFSRPKVPTIVLGESGDPWPSRRLPLRPPPVVALGPAEQRYHASVFGQSGAGKSRLLQSIALQHIRQGLGVGVLEPHHDLSYDILATLVEDGFYRAPDAFERVLYIDWGNGAYVPFNVLKAPYEPYEIASNVLDAFHRVWPSLAEGAAPAFDNVVTRGVRVLIDNGLPLTKLELLVTDQAFRTQCLKKVTDPNVRHYWQGFFDQMRATDQLNEIQSTFRRLSILVNSPVLEKTLGQPENALDFRKIMDAGQAVIINLGNIGDALTQRLVGALLMIQIELAAKSRTNLPPNQRVPFTLLVDEWPAFAAQQDTISHILSQCRKFGLRMYLAAQSLAQVDGQRLVGALENCRIKIAFGLGRDSAVEQAKHIGDVDPMEIKEQATTPTQHNTFLSVPDQYELWTKDLQNLKTRQAYVKISNNPAVKITTLATPDPHPDPVTLSWVLATYRHRYQKTAEEVDVLMRTTVPESKPAIEKLYTT